MDIARLIDGIGPGAALVKIYIGRLAVLDRYREKSDNCENFGREKMLSRLRHK